MCLLYYLFPIIDIADMEKMDKELYIVERIWNMRWSLPRRKEKIGGDQVKVIFLLLKWGCMNKRDLISDQDMNSV